MDGETTALCGLGGGAIRQALEAASRNLLAWPRTLPGGGWMPRSELEILKSRIEDTSSSASALIGLPGTGKSALLAALAADLVEQGAAVLAIKADQLPASVSTEADLQAALGLPAPVSVLLRRAAKSGDRTVLLLDQLDALAGHVDRSTGRLNVLLDLVRSLGDVPGIHIVLSARQFEYQHDIRLREVTAEQLAFTPIAWETVSQQLAALGVVVDGWPEAARNVLLTPQALATFLQLNDRTRQPFAAYPAMLDQLWTERVVRGAGGQGRTRLALEIASQMVEDETLWIGAARYDDHRDTLEALVAAGILMFDDLGGSVGFRHQTLFDHALARAFVSAERLSAFVLSRQDSLFVRPKIWAALTYLRAVEPAAYVRELEIVWAEPGLRSHLRLLLIEFLGQQAAPTDREILLLRQALDHDRQAAAAWRALSGSPGWFQAMKGPLADLMRDPVGADRAVPVLIAALEHDAEGALDLARQVWAGRSEHAGRLWNVLEQATTGSETAVTLAIGVLAGSDVALTRVDWLVSTWGLGQPRAALRILEVALRRGLANAHDQAGIDEREPPPDPDDPGRLAWYVGRRPGRLFEGLLTSRNDWETIPSLAEAAPEAFLEILWPWFRDVFGVIQGYEGGADDVLEYPLAYAADFRFEAETSRDLQEHALLGALRIALERVVAGGGDGAADWIATVTALGVMPAQRLVAHVYSLHPDRYAGEAAAFIRADPRRLYLGGAEDRQGTTARLLRAVSAVWSLADRKATEDYVLALRPRLPDWLEVDRRPYWIQAVRRLRYGALRAMGPEGRSDAARMEVLEGGRLFGESRLGASFSRVSSYGALMDAAAMRRAGDDDILNAIAAVPDASGWSHPGNHLKGGSVQLARAFGVFAESEPDRVIAILARLPDEGASRVAGYALEGLAKVRPEAVAGTLLSLTARGFGGEEFRSSASNAVSVAASVVDMPDAVLETLETWLFGRCTDGDGAPDWGVTGETEETDGEAAYGVLENSSLWGGGGLRVIPHHGYPILEAIRRILEKRDRPEVLMAFLERAVDHVTDPEIWATILPDVVRVAETQGARFDIWLDRLFQKSAVRGSVEAAHALAGLRWLRPDLVAALVPQLVARAGNRRVRQAYGELVGLIWISQPEQGWTDPLVAALVAPDADPAVVGGAALSVANAYKHPEFRMRALDLLDRLDASGRVEAWDGVLDLFRVVDVLPADTETARLLERLVEWAERGRLGRNDATFVLEHLRALYPFQAPLIGRLLHGLAKAWGEDLADVRTGVASISPEVIALAVTLHRLPTTRAVGLEIFEGLMELDAYDTRVAVDDLDNRLRTGRDALRRRLPRRTRRRPRRGLTA